MYFCPGVLNSPASWLNLTLCPIFWSRIGQCCISTRNLNPRNIAITSLHYLLGLGKGDSVYIADVVALLFRCTGLGRWPRGSQNPCVTSYIYPVVCDPNGSSQLLGSLYVSVQQTSEKP